jgi:predicted nucleic acid-binding protein
MTVTLEVLEEYERRIPEVLSVEVRGANVAGPLRWIREKAWLVEAAGLGKQRARDKSDDCFLAAALGSSAVAVVSYDGDLLALEKLFGIPILKPGRFLEWFEERYGN